MSTLRMYRGDAHAWTFDVVLDDEPVDITGVAARFTAKRRASDGDVDAVFTKTVGAGITITDGPAGELLVQLSAADTDSLDAPSTLLWDLQLTGSGRPNTVAGGELRLVADISRTVP